ncbi:MAG: exopolysaccharide biosynthesis protein [Dehalococcoidia bacterium]
MAKKLSLEMGELISTANPVQIKMGELLDTVSQRGFGFLLVALSLPTAFPLPASGWATPFALLIILLAFQMMIGTSSPLLPQRVRSKSISPKMVAFIEKRGIPFLRRMERFSKSRLVVLSERKLFRFLIGVVILLVALVMLIPLPGTNTIFAVAILLMGFGLANNDGLFILGGGLLGLTAVAIMIAFVIAGGQALYQGMG